MPVTAPQERRRVGNLVGIAAPELLQPCRQRFQHLRFIRLGGDHVEPRLDCALLSDLPWVVSIPFAEECRLIGFLPMSGFILLLILILFLFLASKGLQRGFWKGL